MGKLSTHVLDTSAGIPAENVEIELFRYSEGKPELIKTLKTNSDGRTDELLLSADEIIEGQYELVFKIGDYFSRSQKPPSSILFLDEVPVRFGIADRSGNYHVPLLASPWSYSTYRGS